MKLPSIQKLATTAWATFLRFPDVLLCGIVAAIAAMNGLDADAQPSDESWRIAAAASLGLSLLTGLAIFCERRGFTPARTWMTRGLGLAILLLFYWRWTTWSPPVMGVRYMHLSATFHLAVACIAYLGVREHNGFWQFNRTLFLRFCLGGVYSSVLWGGLSLAIAGVDNLFGIDMGDLVYPRLFFLVSLVFQTWFVLSGVPRDFQRLDRDKDYPAGLRVFAQYLLLPLVSVYLIILTLYLGRVVVTTTWPSGWIGYLVSALAAFGIFSLLLIHPKRGPGGHAWIDTYARVFWMGMFPSVTMLLLAIGQRIGQYGMTERRYMLVVLAVWLAGIALYYAVSRSRNIKWIPLTLAVVGIVTFIGPWSVYSVSERSQLNRLEELLASNGALVDGRVPSMEAGARMGDVPNSEWRQINDILRYLLEWHGTDGVNDWFEGGVATVDTIGDGTAPAMEHREIAGRSELIAASFGLVPVGGLVTDTAGYANVSRSEEKIGSLEVAGFDHVILDADLLEGEYEIGGQALELKATDDSAGIVLLLGDMDAVTASLADVLVRVQEVESADPGRAVLPSDALRVDVSGGGLMFRIHIAKMRVRRSDGALSVVSASGAVLLGREAVPPSVEAVPPGG